MVLREEIYSLVRSALEQSIKDGKLPEAEYPPIKVEYPKDDQFGDYSTPIAMESARLLRRNPVEAGEILASYISGSPLVSSVKVVKPGFINIYISKEILESTIDRAASENNTYGHRVKETPLKINIEFVSANPTGPLNVVSARAAAIGDTLATLLEANGDIVDREFYINDFGNQVDLLGRSVLARYKELKGETVVFPEDGYHGEYIKDIAAHVAATEADAIGKIGNDDEALAQFFSRKAIEHNVSLQQKDMEQFKVKYKRWFSERSLHESGSVMKTFEDLEKHNVIYEEEGKKLFRSTAYGDDKDRVVIRDDGRPTYLLADIAYHRDKFARGYDKVIDIWGPDHHGYIARIHGAIQALGFAADRFKVLISQQVNLLSGGELVKMSKRLGNFSTMRDLLDEIGTDVTRYFFVMRSMDSHLDFDLELAKRQSSENPVFYLQYAHARICSVFREAEKTGLKPCTAKEGSRYYDNPESVFLLKCIAKFPDEVVDAAEALEPHRITNCLMRLAQGYHKFYFEHRILTEDVARSSAFLALCGAVKITMANGLALLGVNAPEKM
jgi:arginyl-tRNA synthetase